MGGRTKNPAGVEYNSVQLKNEPQKGISKTDYADEIHHFDEHLGQIIATLEETGEWENTLVIVTADNGMPMPRAKSNGYDCGIHVPLSIRWGGSPEPGKVNETPVGFVDLSATILEAAGIPIPAPFVGQSLFGLLNGSEVQLDLHRAVFSAAKDILRPATRTGPTRSA